MKQMQQRAALQGLQTNHFSTSCKFDEFLSRNGRPFSLNVTRFQLRWYICSQCHRCSLESSFDTLNTFHRNVSCVLKVLLYATKKNLLHTFQNLSLPSRLHFWDSETQIFAKTRVSRLERSEERHLGSDWDYRQHWDTVKMFETETMPRQVSTSRHMTVIQCHMSITLHQLTQQIVTDSCSMWAKNTSIKSSWCRTWTQTVSKQ